MHSAKRDGKRCTPSPATVPSARRQRGRWRHCRRSGEFVARRRCYYAQSACLVVHLDLRSMRSGYFHVWSMGHLHGSVALMCVARSGDVASSGRLSSMAWAFEQWAAWFASVLDWVQLVSRCGFVCGARTPRAIATSFIACIHRGERGRMFASAGGPVGSLWAAPAVRNGHCMSCGRCRGGRALAGDVKGRYMGAPRNSRFLAHLALQHVLVSRAEPRWRTPRP